MKKEVSSLIAWIVMLVSLAFSAGYSKYGGATPKAWGRAVLIETDNTRDAYYPQIACDGSGNAIAVWRQDDGTRYNIWANRFE